MVVRNTQVHSLTGQLHEAQAALQRAQADADAARHEAHLEVCVWGGGGEGVGMRAFA